MMYLNEKIGELEGRTGMEWNGIYTKNVYLYVDVSCCKNQRKRNIYIRRKKEWRKGSEGRK